MILNEINLSLDKINELFLLHRNGIDPENYRVGKIDNKIVVYNPDTQKFMEYFYDDRPDLEWFDLEFINIELKGYKLNRKGECLAKNNITKMKSRLNDSGYPRYQFYKINKYIHTLLAKYFIPNYNPSITQFTDHIDRNKANYSLDNLRWVSRLENNLNTNQPKYYSNQKYKSFLDKDHKVLIKEYSEEEIYNSNIYSKYTIKTSIKNNRIYKGFYWEIENLDILDYLNEIGETSIDDSLWVLHYEKSVYVHPLGIIKSVRKEQLSIGYDRGGYRHYQTIFNGVYKSKCIHRLVAEVFLNDNKPLSEKLVVDHINTNRKDNRVVNLRICTSAENMLNENTLEKIGTKIIDNNGTIYRSIGECSRKNNIPMTTLRSWIKKHPEKGFRYYNP